MFRTTWWILGGLGLAMVGCKQDGTPFLPSGAKSSTPDAPLAAAPAPLPAVEPPAAALTSESEVLGVMAAIDAAAIEASKFAVQRNPGPTVLAYAQRVILDHETSEVRMKEVAKRLGVEPSTSEYSRAFDNDWKLEKAKLEKMDAAKFEIAFLENEAAAHRRAIEAIDLYTLPAAKDPGLRAGLEASRASYQMHLDEAQRIAEQLRRASPGA